MGGFFYMLLGPRFKSLGRLPSRMGTIFCAGSHGGGGWESSDIPNYRVLRVSMLGIVNMVLGRYLLVRYLDP